MSGLAVAADIHGLLSQLNADLAKARALPMETKTHYRCPANLDKFKGVKFAMVLAALPKPDYEEAGSVSYFLTSPVPPNQRGGGFPEITFVPNKSGEVGRVTCFYSR